MTENEPRIQRTCAGAECAGAEVFLKRERAELPRLVGGPGARGGGIGPHRGATAWADNFGRRISVASAIHRKKTPELTFQVLRG